MPTRIFVDTQFVIALINERDEHHRRSVELSQHYQGSPFVTTDVVLLEIGNALARNFRQNAIRVTEDFLSAKNAQVIRLTPELFEQGFALYSKHQDKSWGMTDCISFVVMKELDINMALTYDRHFVQAGFIALMRDE